jgi:hypothetical protein
MIFLNKWLSSHEDVVVFWKDVKESKLNLFTETFARLLRGTIIALKICENAHLPRVNSAFSQIFALFSHRS